MVAGGKIIHQNMRSALFNTELLLSELRTIDAGNLNEVNRTCLASIFFCGILVLVIGLVVGSVVAAKKFLFGDKKIDFSFKTKVEPVTYQCSCCKAKLLVAYKFCPVCSTAKEAVNESKVAAETAQ